MEMTSGFIPILGEHWRNNSLYGLLEALGRFNLCSAWEICRLIDQRATAESPHRRPPSIGQLEAFTAWAATDAMRVVVPKNDVFHIILKVARRDAGEIGEGWFVPYVKWCPDCASVGTHLGVFQHRATTFCPIHRVGLLTQCNYCATRSPYRVQRRTGLFQCATCREPVSPIATVRKEHPDPLPDEREVRRLSECVLIPGLPRARRGPVNGLNYSLLANDIRVLYAMQRVEPEYTSTLSDILTKYFRFARYGKSVTSRRVRTVSRQQSLSPLLKQVKSMAINTGHSCVREDRSNPSPDYQDCPCNVGFRLWLARLRLCQFSRPVEIPGGMSRFAYEESHLGLCLSLAWFASSQAEKADDKEIFDSMISLLEPSTGEYYEVSASVGLSIEWATLDWRFQWLAISCREPAARFRRRLGQLERLRHGSESGVDDVSSLIPWLLCK